MILLAALHFIEPAFDASKRLISEYELRHYGWVMSLAFFSLGLGVLAMLCSTWNASTVRRALIGRWWFVVIAVALFGAGIFYPYTPPNLASAIHGLCGAIVIATFPIAATLYGSALARSKDGSTRIAPMGHRAGLGWLALVCGVDRGFGNHFAACRSLQSQSTHRLAEQIHDCDL